MDDSAYKLTVGLAILDYVGPNLYSNKAAVFAEMIANAWDADAQNVFLEVDLKNGHISIEDDGNGMSRQDLNDKFLYITYKKRGEKITTPSGRHVMGRKGIGKLAFFSLGENLTIETNNGNEKSGCKIYWKDINVSASSNQPYNPEPIQQELIQIEKGTKITLEKLIDEKTRDIKHLDLRRAIARRFTVLDDPSRFTLHINGTPITDKDRPYLNKIQYLWHLGNDNQIVNKTPNAIRKTSINNSIIVSDTQYAIRGWIGTVFFPGDVKKAEINTIALYAHGKLIQEDILKEVSESRPYSEYIIGEIEADFLDDDNLPDIVTSDRQRLNQSDSRYQAIKSFVQTIVRKQISDNWDLWRLEDSIPEFLGVPEISTKYQALSKTAKQSAASLLKKIKSLIASLDDEQKTSIISKCAEFLTTGKIKELKSLSDDELFSKLLELKASSTQTNSATSAESTDSTEAAKSTEPTDSQPTSSTSEEKPTSTNPPATTPSSPEEGNPQDQPETDEPAKGDEKSESSTRKTARPRDDAVRYFDDLLNIIGHSDIENPLKEVALLDTEQAKLAFYNSAFKACAVMLGAILEGIMLGTLRKDVAIQKFLTSSDSPKPIEKLGNRHPQLKNQIAEKLAFQDLKQVIQWLMPELEKLQVEGIQTFRNIVHPWKAVQEPGIYGHVDETRAFNLLTSLVILSRYILDWKP
jgi:hypothetical protein